MPKSTLVQSTLAQSTLAQPNSLQDLDNWRHIFAERQFIRIFWFFVAMLGYLSIHEWSNGQLLNAPIAMLCIPPLFVAAFVRRISSRTRALWVMAPLQAAGLASLSVSGLSLPNNFVFISATITVFALLIGRRFALLSTLCYTALVVGFGIVQSLFPTLAPPPVSHASSMLDWLRVAVTFGGIGLLTVGTISVVAKNTEAVVDRNALFVEKLQTQLKGKLEALKEQQLLQAQVHQAAELQSLGRLAAEVAHDFNNLLVVIINNATLLAKTKPSKDLKDIEEAGQQAAKLCRHLLTMGRERVGPSKRLLLGDAIDGSLKLVRRLLPSNISVDVQLDLDTGWIDGSEAEIEQVILNLCINARDAMRNGGKLRISTHRVQRCLSGDTRKRPFACLRIEDTGRGMNEETRNRIMEPFFTTKHPGKGTELGLAVVAGALEQHNGFLEVQSSLGVGSRFEAFFPGIP